MSGLWTERRSEKTRNLMRRLGVTEDHLPAPLMAVKPVEYEPDPPRRGQIYFVQMALTRHIKVGYAKSAERRLSMLQTSNPERLEIVAIVAGYQSDEGDLHRVLHGWRLHGEWFRHGPWMEQVFESTKLAEDVDTLIGRLRWWQ